MGALYSILFTSTLTFTLQDGAWNKLMSNLTHADNQTVISFSQELTEPLLDLPALLVVLAFRLYSSFLLGLQSTSRCASIGFLLSAVLSLVIFAPNVDIRAIIYGSVLLRALSGSLPLLLYGILVHVISTTAPEKRVIKFGGLFGMSALGQVLAQLLDGFLTPDQVGRQMIGCAVSSLITLLAVFIVVTDKRASTKVGNGASADDPPPPPISQRYTVKEMLYLGTLAAGMVIYLGSAAGDLAVTRDYARRGSLAWTHQRFCSFVIMRHLTTALGGLLILPVMVKQLGLSDLTLVMVALSFKVTTLALTAFSVETWMMYLGVPVEALTAFYLPCSLATFCKLLRPTDTSTAICIVIILSVTSCILSPPFLVLLYESVQDVFPGCVYILLAVLLMVMFGVSLWLSVEIKAYNHKLLVQAIHEADDEVNLEVQAEDWLLAAYDNQAAKLIDEEEQFELAPDPSIEGEQQELESIVTKSPQHGDKL